jgi:hypothetical protein
MPFPALLPASPAYSPSRFIRPICYWQAAAALDGDCRQIAQLGAPFGAVQSHARARVAAPRLRAICRMTKGQLSAYGAVTGTARD